MTSAQSPRRWRALLVECMRPTRRAGLSAHYNRPVPHLVLCLLALLLVLPGQAGLRPRSPRWRPRLKCRVWASRDQFTSGQYEEALRSLLLA